MKFRGDECIGVDLGGIKGRTKANRIKIHHTSSQGTHKYIFKDMNRTRGNDVNVINQTQKDKCHILHMES